MSRNLLDKASEKSHKILTDNGCEGRPQIPASSDGFFAPLQKTYGTTANSLSQFRSNPKRTVERDQELSPLTPLGKVIPTPAIEIPSGYNSIPVVNCHVLE